MCKSKNYLNIIFIFTFIVVALVSLQFVKATGDPLLLLDYEELDNEHFLVHGTFSDLPEASAFAIPIKYNSSVGVCSYNFETQTVGDLVDGVVSKELYDSGNSGFKLYDVITSKDTWGGTLLFNSSYPYFDNENGALSFTVFTLNKNNALENEHRAFSICFKKLSNESPQIKIATKYNTEYYDQASPEGACVAKGRELIKLKVSYNGDVFDSTPDPELPPEENEEEDNSSTSSGTNAGGSSGSGSGGASGSGSASVDESEKDDDVQNPVNTETEDKKDDSVNKKEESISFKDVKDNHWAYEYICGLADMKIVSGYNDGTYRPDNNITRAEIAKIAVAVKGLEPVLNETIFSDSNDTLWYDGYLTAAYKNNIIAGYPDNTFKPENNITREDLCTVLYRMFFSDESESADELEFVDSEEISDYAQSAVKQFYKLGIVSGRSGNKFAPKEYAERAEVAKVVYLCIKAAGIEG